MGLYSVNEPLTEEQKDLIDRMFWGPYADEWRDEKGFADNRDETIANRLGIAKKLVYNYIDGRVNKHFAKVIQYRNKNGFS